MFGFSCYVCFDNVCSYCCSVSYCTQPVISLMLLICMFVSTTLYHTDVKNNFLKKFFVCVLCVCVCVFLLLFVLLGYLLCSVLFVCF